MGYESKVYIVNVFENGRKEPFDGLCVLGMDLWKIGWDTGLKELFDRDMSDGRFTYEAGRKMPSL